MQYVNIETFDWAGENKKGFKIIKKINTSF